MEPENDQYPPKMGPTKLFISGTGFGIAGSARVGGSARGTDPPGGRPWLLGSDFLKKIPEKMAFLGDVCVEKNDFFGKLL